MRLLGKDFHSSSSEVSIRYGWTWSNWAWVFALWFLSDKGMVCFGVVFIKLSKYSKMLLLVLVAFFFVLASHTHSLHKVVLETSPFTAISIPVWTNVNIYLNWAGFMWFFISLIVWMSLFIYVTKYFILYLLVMPSVLWLVVCSVWPRGRLICLCWLSQLESQLKSTEIRQILRIE